MTLEDYKKFRDQQVKLIGQVPYEGFPRHFTEDLRDQYVKSLEAIAALNRIINQMESNAKPASVQLRDIKTCE